MTKRAIFTTLLLLPTFLFGCVTQNYENDNTPVVQNQSNRDDMAATRVSLGLGYLKMGNMPQAKQNLEKAKNFAPDMVQVYTAFAHYYETVGEDKQTVDSYEKALSIKSDDADTLNNYGVYLCRKDKVAEAEKQFLKAIAVPSYILVAKSYENLASCFLQIDNFTKAEMYLNKAILHSPSSASTLLQMVQLQYAIGDYQQAKLFEQRFSKVTRRFTPQSLALFYKVHYKLGERSIAKNYGTMLVKMYAQSWEAQQYLLNELELIEADNLAKRYELSQTTNTETTPAKRVVKLSPTKANKELPTNNEKLAVQTEEQAPTLKTKVENEYLNVNTAKLPENSSQNESADEKQAIIQKVNEEDNTEKRRLVLNAPISEQKETTMDKTLITENESEEVTENQVTTTNQEEAKNFPKFHVVSAGDTLYSISVKYNLKINALRRWNKMSKNKKLYVKDIIFLENPKSVNE